MTRFFCVTALLVFVFFSEEVLLFKLPLNITFVMVVKSEKENQNETKLESRQIQARDVGFIECHKKCSDDDGDWFNIFYDSDSGEDCKTTCEFHTTGGSAPTNIQFVHVSNELINGPNETTPRNETTSKKPK